MKNRYARIGALFVLFTCFSAASIHACRVVAKISAPVPVAGAPIIVRATAVKYVREPRADLRYLNTPGDAEIEFRVEEVIKGGKVPRTLVLNGYLIDEDDYNDESVPYEFVRPRGRGGSCFAYEYKKGAEFLLFMERRDGKITLHWQPLAPINEQLRPADDEWLAWVKDQVGKREPK